MIEGKRNSQGGFLPLSPPNFQSEKRKKLGKKSSRQSATLCNHAAQSITRQTVRLSTLPLSLSLLHTQFFKRPSSPIRLLARIGHRQRGPRSNLNLLWQKYIYIYTFEISNHHDLIHQMKTDFGQVLSRFQSFRGLQLQLFLSSLLSSREEEWGEISDFARIVSTRCHSMNRNGSNSISLASCAALLPSSGHAFRSVIVCREWRVEVCGKWKWRESLFRRPIFFRCHSDFG